MNREFKNEYEMSGLEEINRTEKSEVNGGYLGFEIIIVICCHDIPPSKNPNDLFIY